MAKVKEVKEKLIMDSKKSVKEQILELKKQRLLKLIQDFITKKKQQEKGAIVLPNPNNSYRNIYLCYRNWQKKYPNELPSIKSL